MGLQENNEDSLWPTAVDPLKTFQQLLRLLVHRRNDDSDVSRRNVVGEGRDRDWLAGQVCPDANEETKEAEDEEDEEESEEEEVEVRTALLRAGGVDSVNDEATHDGQRNEWQWLVWWSRSWTRRWRCVFWCSFWIRCAKSLPETFAAKAGGKSRGFGESEVARMDGPERMPKTILVASKCRIIYRSVHVELLACEQESDKEAPCLHCRL